MEFMQHKDYWILLFSTESPRVLRNLGFVVDKGERTSYVK